MGSKNPSKMLWLDLETTGTDREHDLILEIGYVITTYEWPFTEITRGELVINQPRLDMLDMATVVIQMHTDNGLFDDSRASTIQHDEAEKMLCDVLAQYDHKHGYILAGSGVGHFDKGFLDKQMPDLAKWLRYYVIDVGVLRRTLGAIGRTDLINFGNTFADPTVKPHRGLADVLDHLHEYRTYAAILRSANADGLTDLDDVTPPVTHRDPSKAEAAAAARLVEFPTAKSRRRVLEAIAGQHPHPVTAKEVGHLIGSDRDHAHPRMRELHKGGWIDKTGGTRTDSIHDGDLWRLTRKAMDHPDVEPHIEVGICDFTRCPNRVHARYDPVVIRGTEGVGDPLDLCQHHYDAVTVALGLAGEGNPRG